MQEEEYRAAVQRYRDMVWRVALNACRQTQDAEDVVQDVFLKLYTTRREFDGEEHLKHWLLRVTVNRCRTLLACPWRTRRADAVPDAPDPAQALDAGQRALYEAVRALPPGQRVALYLYYFEGYSTAEIAQLLHLRQTAVTTRLHRARTRLRALLEETPE